MSISNRMYDRLCKLYRLVLVRMRHKEAVMALPMLPMSAVSAGSATTCRVPASTRPTLTSGSSSTAKRVTKKATSNADPYARHALEPLEPRVLLSVSTPALAGMHLADSDITNWQGQIVYLDFDGQADVTYDGAVNVGPFDIPTYQAPQPQQGQEEAIQAQVLDEVQSIFAGTGVQLTLIRPEDGTAYSTVHIGGDDSAFHPYGRFDGLADGVDVGNQNPNDNALVFSAGLSTTAQLVQVITHETAHLLGYAHEDASEAQDVLSNVAVNTYTIASDITYVNQNARQLSFIIIRSDISTTQTLYVSTLQDQGDINEGNYDELDHLAITFDEGKNTAEVSVIINDLGLATGSKTFRLIIQDSSVDPQGPVLATSDFTIVNNASGTFGTSYLLGLDTDDTGIVDYLSELYDARHRFIGLHLGQDSDHLTAADAAQIQAAGMKVFSIFEQDGMTDIDENGDHTYAWQSYYTEAQGEADAAAAYISATQYALQPFDSAIYFSIDLNPADTSGISQQDALDQISLYFQGIQTYFSTLPPESSYTIGVMGAGDTLTQVTNDGLAQYTWLASTGAWPGYSDWNPSNNYPAESNVIQLSAITPQSKYGNIVFNRDVNWSLPLGSWHEVITPQLSVNAAELALTHFAGESSSSSSFIRVQSQYLSPDDMVTITAPDGFEVSTAGGEYSGSVTLTPVNGYLFQGVYIRINADALADVQGELTITSNLDSSLNKTVQLTGEVWATDDITEPTVDAFDVSPNLVSPGSLVNLSYTVSDTGGAGLWYVQVYRAADINGVPGSYAFLNSVSLSGLSLPSEATYSDAFTDTPDAGTWWYKIVVRDNNQTANDPADVPIAVTVQDMTPTVTAISPASGSTEGGTAVVITGTFFSDATQVQFGGVAAASFTVDSDTQITAYTPANAIAGEVDVAVTTPEGTTAVTSASQFTYEVFEANLTPYLPEGWSNNLVLSHQLGTFTEDSQLYAGQDIYADFSVVNTGNLAAGSFNVELVFWGAYERTVTLGTITSLGVGEVFSFEDVNVGQLPEGYRQMRVEIDPANAIIESNENDNNHAYGKWVLRTPDTVAPVVNSFEVTQTVVAPGDIVDFSYQVSDTGGSGLRNVYLVWAEDVNGVPSDLTNTISHTIEGDGPVENQFTRLISQTTGTWWYMLRVRDADGNTSMASDYGLGPILMTVQNQPAISGIDLTTGLIQGGETVVITGTDFSNATAVHFGDIETTNFTIDSDTQITVVTPVALNAGVVDVTVTTPVGTSPVTGAAQFTYIELLADLTPHQPVGWFDELVVSNQAGINAQPNEFFDTDDLFLYWSITNDGDAAAAAPFTTALYVDGVLKHEWETAASLSPVGVFLIEDFALGNLSVGSHTLELVIDSNDSINEYSEANNTYTKLITVSEVPNLPPSVWSIIPFDVPQNGDVEVQYILVDDESDLSSVTVQYSADGGATWLAATPGVGGDGIMNLVTSPSGITHTFVWDSYADLPNTHSTQVQIRIIVSDEDNTGTTGPASSSFTIDQPPTVANLNATLDQDTALLLSSIDFASAFSDPDTGDALALLGFTSLPEHGTITYNGSPVQLDVVYTPAQLASLIYTPNAGYFGSDSFGWRASDGSLYSTNNATVNLTINEEIVEPGIINLNFDFGTQSSVVLADATKVANTTSYTAAIGYGWQSGSVDSRDRGAIAGTNALTRDLNFTSQAVFAVDVPDGSYIVTVQLGDAANYLHDSMGVAFENGSYDSVNSAKGQVVTKTYIVQVTDGQLNLKLKDLGGVDANVCIQGLQIVSNIQISYPPTLDDMTRTMNQDTSVALDGASFAAAFHDQNLGDALQMVKFVTLPANGSLQLNGSLVTAGQEILASEIYSLIYTPTTGFTGTDTFTWNGSDGEQYADADATVELTVQELGNYLYDFGTSDSVVEVGYQRVTESTTYAAGLGYGWLSGKIQSRDRGASPASDALTQDLHFTSNGVFAVDLSDGSYNVTLHLGDAAAYPHDQMGVYMENELLASVSTVAGEVISVTYNVSVTDGQLTIRLKDLGGIDANICIVGLEITSGPPIDHLPVGTDINKDVEQNTVLAFSASDFISAFTDPDPGDSLQHVTILDLPVNGELLLDGAAVTIDQQIAVSLLSTLTYTPNAGYSGQDSFGWVGSNGSQSPENATTVNLTIGRHPVYDFDFGTNSSPLLTGNTKVTHTTTYNAAQGYGWQSGSVDSRDRGALSGTNAQTRDLNFTNEAVFAVDVQNGSYEVTVILGDAEYAHDQMGVFFENTQYDSVTTGLKQVVSRTFTVNVADGQLSLKLKDLGGIDPNVCIQGLTIFKIP